MSDGHTARLCPYCARPFGDYEGVQIHAAQAAGDGPHPDEVPPDIEKSDCPVARVDDEMNVIEVVEAGAMLPSTRHRLEAERDAVPIDAVADAIGTIEEEGHSEAARRMRELLF